MAIHPKDLDLTKAVAYHDGRFPPESLDLELLIEPLTAATAALSRYDEMMRRMLNSEVLLAPLRSRDAVVSSRMEGTISTLDDVLRLGAEEDAGDTGAQQNARSETVEVFLYARALSQAQDALRDGVPFSDWLVRRAHQTLLMFGRGAQNNPGQYKSEQNYIGERGRKSVVHFIPISPENLPVGMDRLFHLMAAVKPVALLRAALAHVEFEALHPFDDGNGRVGRMLIPLMLWRYGLIHQPHFFVSGYFEDNKAEYVERMRRVSSHGEWSEWCRFFLLALEAQAQENIETAEAIQSLYLAMRQRFQAELSSQWAGHAVDYVFANPIFRNSRFTSNGGIPVPTAIKISRRLFEAGLLKELQSASGRRAALYAFEPLLEIVRER